MVNVGKKASINGISNENSKTQSGGVFEVISFYGNTDIIVESKDLSPEPTKNIIYLYNTALRPCPWIVPSLLFNGFKSSPAENKIIFTAPSILDLMWDVNRDWIFAQKSIKFELRVFVNDLVKSELTFKNKNYITIEYSPDYTPLCYYLSPRTLYQGSEFSVFCDPKLTTKFASSESIKIYIDGTQQDLTSRGANPNVNGIVNGAKNEIKVKATNQDPSASADFRMASGDGDSKNTDSSMNVCMPDGEGCYYVKTLPKITKISTAQGYTSGGQTLTIDGWGFKAKVTSVKIQLNAGNTVDCKNVKFVSNTRITCTTNKVDDATLPGIFVGAPGVLRKLYQGYGVQPTYANFDKTSSIKIIDQQIYTTIENPQNIGDTYLTQYVGVFIPQVKGTYRFYLACDDTARVFLGTDDNKLAPPTIPFAELSSWTSYRNFRNKVGVSAFRVLEAGIPYYLEVQHVEGGGGDHVSLGMEIQLEDVVDEYHYQAIKEVQQLVISQPQNFDLITWVIDFGTNQPNVGNYTVRFANDDNYGESILGKGTSFEFNVTFNAAQVCSMIQGPIYQAILKSDAVCTVTRYDANNATVSAWSSTRKVIVTVRSTKFLSFNAFTKNKVIILLPANTGKASNAVIKVHYLEQDSPQLGRPLQGQFQIKCYQQDGVTSGLTTALAVTASSATIKYALISACPDLLDNIEVIEGGEFSGLLTNGRDIQIRFLNSIDFPQFTIQSSTVSQIQAGTETPPIIVTLESFTTIDYNSHTLFYDQIPVEFLRTFNTKPQVIVSVDGLEAVCTPGICDYSYFKPTVQCQSVDINGQNIEVSCTGTGTGSQSDIPTNCVTAVGNDKCIGTTTVNSNIYQCNLKDKIPTGAHDVTITCDQGSIDFTGSQIVEDITINSLTPTEVYRNGGQQLIITGDKFPTNLNLNQIPSPITVSYDGSKCIPTAISKTELTCLTGAVPDSTPTSGAKVQVEVCINGKCANNLDIGIKDPIFAVQSISPNPVSPVLRTNMIIEFTSPLPLPFAADQYQVKFISKTNPSYFRKVAVKELINGNQLSLRFLGAYAGEYTVEIIHTQFGKINVPSTFSVDVNSYIDTITPSLGSPAGGTIITITGGPFSTNGLENNVMIGNTNCIVSSSSLTTIICKVEPKRISALEGQKEELFVFLKAAEYGVCNVKDNNGVKIGCLFTWDNSDGPTVESVQTTFDLESQSYISTLTGTFPGASSVISLDTCPTITCNGDNTQETIFCDETTFKVKYTLLSSILINQCSIDTIQGSPPNSFALLTSSIQAAFVPVFTGLNVNVGSAGGSYITAAVGGLAPDTTHTIKLLTSAGKEICTEYVFDKFQTIHCKTYQGLIGQSLVKLNLDGVDVLCTNSDANKCKYQQTTTDFPAVTTATISTDHMSITLTGINFQKLKADSWTPICGLAGVYTDKVVDITDTSATCLFEVYGVPFVQLQELDTTLQERPEFKFESISKTPTITHWASVTPSLINTITPGIFELAYQSPAGYGGGTLLTIQNTGHPGLTAALRTVDKDVKILVCDQECVFKPLQSDIDTTVCVLPKMNTDYTNDDERIKKEKNNAHRCNGKKTGSIHCALQGENSSSNKKEGDKVFADSSEPCTKKANSHEKENSNSYGKNPNNAHNLRMLTEKPKTYQDDKLEEHDKKEKEEKKKDQLVYNENAKGWSDLNGNCFLGQKFKRGTIGAVSEVHFFLSPVDYNPSRHHGVQCQGTNDEGHTWHHIFTLHQSELKHSWNYKVLPEEARFAEYRFLGTGTSGSCTFGKLKFLGQIINVKTEKDNTRNCHVTDPHPPPSPQVTCDIKIQYGTNEPIPIFEDGTGQGYDGGNTPTCSSISPQYGPVQGGTSVTITGVNFSPNMLDYVIKFDNILCDVTDATLTSVTCTTRKRPLIWDAPQTYLNILNHGGDVECGVEFYYVNEWSNSNTWGGDGQPEEDESIWIPAGLTLLVDIANTPILKEVIVEGTLIFDTSQPCPNDAKTLDAYWIFANGGNIIIGTEQNPYPCKLIITLHGDRLTPEVPLFGNEVIGIRGGNLEIHGKPALPTWADLESTAFDGALTITLHKQVNWQVDDEIVIASTSYDLNEAEVRTIKGIDIITNGIDKPILTLDAPLGHKHFAGIEDCLDGNVEMRGEVGLLTRNIVIKGDDNSKNDENGAVIAAYSVGDDTSIVKIEYVEMRKMGQAYKLGRYAIHLRVLGKMTASYIRGNSVRDSYNRFIALHTNGLTVEDNVAFEVKGHAIFIEDALEQDNKILNNLVINTRKSWSLQNTDQTPAAYFIRHPSNTFTSNRAAGSEGYGFWFNLPSTPTGISSNPGVCPSGIQLQAFEDNAAHSCEYDGLKQISIYHPRTYSCNPSNAITNPPITAFLNNFRSWKNKGDGATFDRVGDVRITNFQGADNLGAGIEYSLTDLTDDNTAQIDTAVLVGISSVNSGEKLQTDNLHGWGVITARSENFTVRNVQFCKYNKAGYAAIKTCSNCDVHYTLTDSGARTTTFEKLKFEDKSVTQRVIYTWPYNAILYDIDGSLTEIPNGGWATPYWKHNEQKECKLDQAIYNGLVCDGSIQVRRIAFSNYQPSYFDWADLKVLSYDQYLSDQTLTPIKDLVYDYSLTATPSNQVNYVLYDVEPTHYSVIPFKQYTLPNNGWAIPFVTGKTYKIHWRTGLDFQKLMFELSYKWTGNDYDIKLIFNMTEHRESILVNITSTSTPQTVERNSLAAKPASEWKTGDNRLWNQTEIRQLHVIANGREQARRQVTLFGYNCLLWCPDIPAAVDANGEIDCPGVRLWSDVNSWQIKGMLGHVPVTGDSVYIWKNCHFIYDYDSTKSPQQILNSVIVEGTIEWAQTGSLILNTKFLFIRGGHVLIGKTETTEFFSGALAEIVLHGDQTEQYLAYSTWIEAGGKVLAVAGELKMFGKERQRRSRLLETAKQGSQVITVEGTGLDWVVGDMIALAATNNDWRSAEQAIIKTYDSGVITLVDPLKYTHYGSSKSDHYGADVDVRGEVYLMTSNVRVSGADTDFWGGAIVVSDFKDNNGKTMRNGQLQFDNVEVYNCSQYDTYKAALRFESTGGIDGNSVKNSVFRNGLGKGLQILNSKQVYLENNIFFDFRQWGGNIQKSSQITLHYNVFFHIGVRYTAAGIKIPPNGGLIICALQEEDNVCKDLSVMYNIVSGADYAGFGVPGSDCPDKLAIKSSTWFKFNVAHSNNGAGAIFFPDPSSSNQLECFQAISFTSYKNRGYGAITYSTTSKAIYFSDFTLIDNYINAAMQSGYGTEPGNAETSARSLFYKNIKFYGDSPDNIHQDCDTLHACQSPYVGQPNCHDRAALLLSSFTTKSNLPFPRDLTEYDEIYSDASWQGIASYEDVTFTDYESTTTHCGERQQLFTTHRNETDYYPIQTFTNTKFSNVGYNVLGGFWKDPNIEWAVVEKCGNFPCSGPKNIVLRFESSSLGSFRSIDPISQTFYIISNNGDIGPQMGCTRVDDWNGYQCIPDKISGKQPSIGQLIFESLDSDFMTRTFSPVSISNDNLVSGSPSKKFNNILNSFSDKGFNLYGGQQRRARFVSTVKTGPGFKYDVSYTGTVPQQQRFRLDASENEGFVISIQYTEQNSYAVSVDGKGIINYNAWDTTNRIMKPVSPNGVCGENRYIAVQNILEFMIKPSCTITISPRNVIMASVRLEWTLDEFYSSGGTTLFIDRISAALGIHPSTVKIVTVYLGSVVVNYHIQNPTTDKAVLPAIKAKLDAVMKVGATFLGAPILDYDASFPVPQDDIVTPQEGKPVVVNNTKPIIISQNLTVTEETTAPVMTKEQVAKLVIIVGSVLGVCVAVSIIVWCICRKRKGDIIAIHVQQKGDQSTKQGINISQEYDAQYHPKSEIGKVFDFDELDKKKKAKVNADEVEEMEVAEQEIQKPTDQEEEWRQDWDHDTVRTNANKYTDENYLMNSPQARNISLDFSEQVNKASDDVQAYGENAPSTAQVKDESIYVETD